MTKLERPCCVCLRETVDSNAKPTPDGRFLCVPCSETPRGKELLREARRGAAA